MLLQESVEVPEPPEMFVEESEHERLVEFVVAARETVFPNPLADEITMLAFPEPPAVVDTVVGFAVIVKS